MHLIYLLPNGTIIGVTCLKTKLFWVKPVKIIHLVHAQIFGKTIISYPIICTRVILLNNGATFEIFKLSRKVLFSRGKLKRYLNESHTVKHLFYNDELKSSQPSLFFKNFYFIEYYQLLSSLSLRALLASPLNLCSISE